MKIITEEKGFIKPIIGIIITILLIFIAYKFIIPYYKYSALKMETKSVAKLIKKQGTIDKKMARSKVFEKAKGLKIPINETDIIITITRTEDENIIIIHTSWSETVNIFDVFRKRLIFNIDVTER